MIAPILAVVKLGRTYDGQLKVKNHAVSFVSKNFEVLNFSPVFKCIGFSNGVKTIQIIVVDSCHSVLTAVLEFDFSYFYPICICATTEKAK